MDRAENGALGRIRTSDHLIRSQVLYPTELRARKRLEDQGLSKKPSKMQAKDFAIVKSAILEYFRPMIDVWKHSFNAAQETLSAFMGDPQQFEKCQSFAELLIQTYTNGGKVFSAGNGGSHCDAMHFAEELTGRYKKDRRPLGALALGDPSHVTCVSNDYGFNFIFSRQLEGLGREGDLFLGLSTSGNSANILEALRVARKCNIKTVALLGKDGGQAKDFADLAIVVPANDSGRIQEVHIKIIHTVIEVVERHFFPENYE